MTPSTRKFLVRSVVGMAIVFGLFTIATGVHLYMITGPKSDGYNQPDVQLGRIDFAGILTDDDASKIQHVVRSMPGVKTTYMNRKDNILVFTYRLTQQSGENIFKALTMSEAYDANAVTARRYATPSTTKGGCPINAKQASMYRRIGELMHSIVD